MKELKENMRKSGDNSPLFNWQYIGKVYQKNIFELFSFRVLTKLILYDIMMTSVKVIK